MCLNIGTPKNINFPFETNGKLKILGVPIFKHFVRLLDTYSNYFRCVNYLKLYNIMLQVLYNLFNLETEKKVLFVFFLTQTIIIGFK